MRLTASMQSVVAAFVPLAQSGAEWRGECPECEQSALVIHADVGRCMECGWAGGALEYLCLRTGCTETEAQARLGNGEFHEPPPAELLPRPPLELVPADDVPPDVEGWHVYRNREGEPWAYSDGSKWRTHGRYGASDPPRWYKRAPATPRPLYGLERLTLTARVILCESEREADVAAKLFPRNPCCACGGQHGHKLTDWTPLAGRAVLLVPRNDAAGQQAMQRVAAALLQDVAGCVVSGLDTTDQPEGWTLCDAADWTPDAALTWAQGRIVEYPQPLTAAQQADILQDNAAEGGDSHRPDATATASGTNSVTGGAHPPNAPQSSVSDAAEPDVSDMPPPAEFPPEATTAPPAGKRKRRKPDLYAVDGNTVRHLEIEPEPADLPAFAEMALADRFVRDKGADWRYTAAWKQWHRWDDVLWRADERMQVTWEVAKTCRIVMRENAGATPAQRMKVTTLRVCNAVIGLSATYPHVATGADQWDADIWLLGTPEGVIDLRHGKLVESSREQMVSKSTSVAPQRGPHPHWDSVIQRACRGDDSMRDYLQRLAGMLLTGDVSEEVLCFIHGPGASGKSTFVSTLQDILGMYAATASIGALTAGDKKDSSELADLAGARLVVASETPEGSRWDEPTIKMLTGRDRIRARQLYQRSFSYTPTFKILVVGNHRPTLRSVAEDMRRRLHLIEFPDTIPQEERDPGLREKIRLEHPAILQWMIDGCLAWQDVRLGKPEAVERATAEYLVAEDTFSAFLDDCIEPAPAATTLSGDAYRTYRNYCERAGEYVVSQKRFTQRMQDRGYASARTAAGRILKGFRLIPQDAHAGAHASAQSKPVQGVDF